MRYNMDSKLAEEVSLPDLFEQFVEATTMRNILSIHHKLLSYANLSPCEFNVFFPKFKRAITASRQKKNWKAKALFSKIDKRAAHKCYSNTKTPTNASDKSCDTNSSQSNRNEEDDASFEKDERNFNNNHALKNYNCLVIGSGPAGLRTAIELQLLGASRVVIVEKRGRFSRNNVLHLWPFVIDDLKSLGAKKFYGKFCAGSIDHISIRQLQLMLLKVCLMIGCEFRDSCSYIELCPASLEANDQANKRHEPLLAGVQRLGCELEQELGSKIDEKAGRDDHQDDSVKVKVSQDDESVESEEVVKNGRRGDIKLKGVRAHFQCDQKSRERELHSIEWDIILGADGRRNTLGAFFPRIEFRGRLAIAITANFINRQTPAETSVPEISGLSFIYNQDMFNALAYDTNIQLENICYYKDDTHYFVMTAKKTSLLERGVLINDYATTKDLLSDHNVNKDALLKYAKDAAFWTTGLEPLDFALNHYGKEDCAMFDFTSMYAASNACRALRTSEGGFALLGLVGDSLLEPFWPTGSGCARGFLSSFDAAWMCRQWAVNRCAVIDNHHCSSRSSRNRNTNGVDFSQSIIEPTTYDRMAMSVIAERESIYRILAQTKSENLQQNYSHWTLNPHTRYPNLNRHLVSPAQVDHLVGSNHGEKIFDSKLLSPKSVSSSRRIKSPTNEAKSRRSPKKLKSAGASPLAQPKSAKNHYKSKQAYKSKSRNDLTIDDYYLEFEQSYKDLDDKERGGTTQYLNYKQRNSIDLDDLFVPSLSGTLPSSSNLSKLEARKARDIDECLRQRRQKSKINIVRDQLISQMRGERKENGSSIISGGNVVLFNEIRRMREQQSRGSRADSKPRDVANGPLSLLNSMRRCASFAERVKSFENKLSKVNSDTGESVPSTPKTPIDNVKNLPQFATLQELIINNAQNSIDQTGKRYRAPVTKLSKDDWNVACWERRLSNQKQTGLSLSTRSLNKTLSVDSGQEQMVNRVSKPKLQTDVFQARIRQMAGKLESGNENNETPRAPCSTVKNPNASGGPVRSQGWINHLKRELSKGSDYGRRSVNGRPMNPVLPNKPIKKLFEDDEADEHDIDINKHYDHLCLNRPTNKYLAKGAYTSHLARTKYSSATSRVVERPKPTAENKLACLAATLNSRGSSASSTVSDYSTNTGNSSSSSGAGAKSYGPLRTSVIDVECFRCNKFVSTSERITLGSSSLHRGCLTCAHCSLTLRTNEIQHYLDQSEIRKRGRQQQVGADSFLCAICEPNIRVELTQEARNRLAQTDDPEREQSESIKLPERRLPSREEFLNSRINYQELYKNILSSESVEKSSEVSKERDRQQTVRMNPSPTQVTLPMKLAGRSDAADDETRERRASEFSIAGTHTVDGREQVTVILSPGEICDPGEADKIADVEAKQIGISRRVSKESDMIDEEELQRILHLDNRRASRKSSDGSTSSESAGENETSGADDKADESDSVADEDDEDDDDDDDNNNNSNGENHPRTRDGSSASSASHLEQNSDVSSPVGLDESSTGSYDNSSSLDIPSDSE